MNGPDTLPTGEQKNIVERTTNAANRIDEWMNERTLNAHANNIAEENNNNKNYSKML